MKRATLFIFLILISLIFGSKFAFGQVKILQPPGTLEEVKTQGSDFLRSFPGAIRSVFPEGLAVFQKVWRWLKNIWNSFFYLWFKSVWKEIELIVKQRKPVIQEEFKKEKKEMREEVKTELPGAIETGKSLWQRLKDLIR